MTNFDFKNLPREYVMTVYKYYDAFIFEPAVLTPYVFNSVKIYFSYEKETFDKYAKEDKIILDVLGTLGNPDDFRCWRECNPKENPRAFLKEKGYYNMLDS